MPIYDFKCEKCEHQFSSMKTIANRDEPLGEPCPKCNRWVCREGILERANTDARHQLQGRQQTQHGWVQRRHGENV